MTSKLKIFKNLRFCIDHNVSRIRKKQNDYVHVRKSTQMTIIFGFPYCLLNYVNMYFVNIKFMSLFTSTIHKTFDIRSYIITRWISLFQVLVEDLFSFGTPYPIFLDSLKRAKNESSTSSPLGIIWSAGSRKPYCPLSRNS